MFHFSFNGRRRLVLGASVFACAVASTHARAQMVTNAGMPGFSKAFNLPQVPDNAPSDSTDRLIQAQRNADYALVPIASSTGINALSRGQQATFTFRLTNTSGAPMNVQGRVEVISYSTRVQTGDIWVPLVSRGKLEGSTPVSVRAEAGQTVEVRVRPNVPARFGGYALVFDLGRYGRAFGAAVSRVVSADKVTTPTPSYSLDFARSFDMSDAIPLTMQNLGVQAARAEWGYIPTTSPDFQERMADLDRFLAMARRGGVRVMLTIGAGHRAMPLGRGRPYLRADATMREGEKEDLAWFPANDADFQKWIELIATRHGYPRGPVNAMELWNEPWEGVSISGWGADSIRYREIYSRMAAGIQNARRKAGVRVLIGGASSSSNTIDKLFARNTNEYLPILDFVSLHYQPMGATPALIPQWMNRQHPNGRVKVWDTESWIANSEDRVGAVVASMRAMGHDRVKGTYGGNVYTPQNTGEGAARRSVVHAWAPSAAVAASAKYIGERPFRGLLFQNGLPWVFVFDGPRNRPDDGTVVVVGDLGGVYNRDQTLFRGVFGLKNEPRVRQLRARLASLPANVRPEVRTTLQNDLKAAQVLDGATLSLGSGNNRFRLIDSYGNPVASRSARISVPLNGLGYFLRTDGSRGSFARLVNALRAARIDGYEPLDIVAHDFTAPLSSSPNLRLTLTNVLNRSVSGVLSASVPNLRLQSGTQRLTLRPHETRVVSMRAFGKSRPDNAYPLAVSFNAGRDGVARHEETVRANVISKRTIQVDGRLNEREYRGAVPHVVTAQGIARSQTEAAWLPFKAFPASTSQGQATAYCAYDAKNFYFAAKIADATPHEGSIRFAKRDDDSYFYPPVSYTRASGATTFSARWSGELEAPVAGRYTLTTLSDDGVRLFLNGKKVIDNWTDHGPTEDVANVELPQGRHSLVIEYYQGGGGATAKLFWQQPGRERELVPTSRLYPTEMNTGINGGNGTNVGTGLRAEFFANRDLSGDPVATRLVNEINLELAGGQTPDPAFDKSPLVAMRWPEGVRRFSYRRDPDLPDGTFPSRDNVQIAFNAVPLSQEPWLPNAKGTPPRWQFYRDTDYEFALNQVAPRYGGGTEMWRLQVPGMQRKHFYPRQPKQAIEGPARGVKLVMRREGNTRIVEAAIPWSEIPHVRKRLQAKQPLKFSFRVNDNDGPSYEMAQNRSVSKLNNLAFHTDWVDHWANEVEWGWQ